MGKEAWVISQGTQHAAQRPQGHDESFEYELERPTFFIVEMLYQYSDIGK